MPTSFPTSGFGAGEQAAANLQAPGDLQARSQVIANVENIYRDVELYPSANIHHASYGFLGIDCRPLKLDENGKHLEIPASDPSSPIFFGPKGAAWVPDVCETDPQVTTDLRRITDEWENAKNDPLVRSLHSQVWYVFLGLERMFFQFCREFDLEGDGESLLNLRQVSKWVKSTIVPSVIADRFYPAIWGSMRCSPAAAFVPKELLYPAGTPPHTLIHILIEQEPNETLTRAEVMILTATMVTRLEGEDCLKSDTIPVMAITIFGQMKARVIEAYCNPQVLVIKKTDLLDFSTNKVANKNIDILLGFMCADLVENAREPTVPTKTLEVYNTDIVNIGNLLTLNQKSEPIKSR
ncbi:unnamed protein product [Penicillium nalgiovense]|uniref:Uncharacterized protein n=1 Tax=Penicillium nalgiovense TaxID=60175 RepID=A0A9W4I200_PENNA|nr:unnamed protein product [Penicillium nalgiovense]CAG7999680.1 unnamed protein product [Penicillium nalgiovense]CAG8082515.1 unnamed protein product [Penicillium nalgiovense]CAG8102863.1 unnamed protein product [Penicillium nalgiovense]CAG8110100.1 unnamed protein product [Penicillium nalgiovense]